METQLTAAVFGSQPQWDLNLAQFALTVYFFTWMIYNISIISKIQCNPLGQLRPWTWKPLVLPFLWENCDYFPFIFSAPGLVVDYEPNLCLLTLTPVSVEAIEGGGLSHPLPANRYISPVGLKSRDLASPCSWVWVWLPSADVWPSSVVSVILILSVWSSVLFIAISLAGKNSPVALC